MNKFQNNLTEEQRGNRAKQRTKWLSDRTADKIARGIEMAQMIADGISRKEVSERYNLSIRTVEGLFNELQIHMDVNNLQHLIAELIREKLIK